MKILIEHHKKEYPEMTLDYYHVKFKRKWWSPWSYIERPYSHSNPETRRFVSLAEAIRVAKELRAKYDGPNHIVTDLDINGEPINKYCGG